MDIEVNHIVENKKQPLHTYVSICVLHITITTHFSGT